MMNSLTRQRSSHEDQEGDRNEGEPAHELFSHSLSLKPL